MDLTPLAAALLGLLQGLTEFLPVSSSGHLVIAQRLLGFAEPALAFDVWLHLATLCAVLLFYRRDILAIVVDVPAWLAGKPPRPAATSAAEDQIAGPGHAAAETMRPRPAVLGALVVLATIPTGLLGVLCKERVEALFGSPVAVGWMLALTALALASSAAIGRLRKGANHPRPLDWWRALALGVAQGIAIVPGISRSGATIVAGLWLGLEREQAARVSFLLSIPAILGATVLHARHLSAAALPGSGQAPAYLLAFAVAAISGWLALAGLLRLVRAGRLWLFAPYLLVAASVVLTTWW